MSLESIFNHLVLPTKVPGGQDPDLEGIDAELRVRMIGACQALQLSAPREFLEALHLLQRSLRACHRINKGRLDRHMLQQELPNVTNGITLILHIVEQNAGLLIRSEPCGNSVKVIFEVLETSPTSDAVLAADQVLQWDFPGRAVEISTDDYLEESFQKSLAQFLEQASMERLQIATPVATKGGVKIGESRATVDPVLITQMLMPMLEAIGAPCNVPRIRKRVRDEVNLRQSELPWRRSPFWLLLRVGVQRQLQLNLGNVLGRACYKILNATLLAEFLRDITGHLAPELVSVLQAKLARRLAKLEVDKQEVGEADLDAFSSLFQSAEDAIATAIRDSKVQVESSWRRYQQSLLRRIPKLPMQASPRDQRVTLLKSGNLLQEILSRGIKPTKQTNGFLSGLPSLEATGKRFSEFARKYSALGDREQQNRGLAVPQMENLRWYQTRCKELALDLTELIQQGVPAYSSNPEQMSNLMLALFDMWKQMDECATKACPVLLDFHPIFKPEILDCVQLPPLADMILLNKIQTYMHGRIKNCKFPDKTVFSKVESGCFAVKYLEAHGAFLSLSHEIESASDASRKKMESQWNKVCREYDDLTEQIQAGTCVCTVDQYGERDVKGCTKCFHWRKRKRLTVEVHEDFLPRDWVRKAAVLFELQMPGYLRAYRNAAWRLVKLAHPSKPDVASPKVLLYEYQQLRPWIEDAPVSDVVTLASAKKSFLNTHYKGQNVKVERSSILLPNPLDFMYYDVEARYWLHDLEKQLTFQHLCGIRIPHALHDAIPAAGVHPPPKIDGPSSYEILANQAKCPLNMSLQEFTAYQQLLSGKNCRWPTILRELDSPNLNFSNEEVMMMLDQLITQAGPSTDPGNPLRAIHCVFEDMSFCRQLARQVDIRLRAISSNWHEIPCMDVLITLSLRLFSLAPRHGRRLAQDLLENARGILLTWIAVLRSETRESTTADAADRAAIYGLQAALLCRRTFTTLQNAPIEINSANVCEFVQASLAMQENLMANPSRLPTRLKDMLIRDAKMVSKLRSILRSAVQNHQESLASAIGGIWSGSGRKCSAWTFVDSSDPGGVDWVTSTMMDELSPVSHQVIHYNFIEGHLLVNYKSLVRLPQDIRESSLVQKLFSNRHLLTCPSSMMGMSHMLLHNQAYHEIHFGLRDGKVVIRDRTSQGVLELVDRNIFTDGNCFDLPSNLIENCAHWLNLDSRKLEIRSMTDPWKIKSSNWVLDLDSNIVKRRQSYLVDPYSPLAKEIALVFEGFEDSGRLTIFQAKSRLCVELKHLELSFFVNKRRQLCCNELDAVIDWNQDAGTWYGFVSKIVLRDNRNHNRRFMITASGPLESIRSGMHVSVHARGGSDYLKFSIDDIVGRVACPPEPKLLYSKALFHAATSFVLPDDLTGRTGTEEALDFLSSGICQPWKPLSRGNHEFLENIRTLSPHREYYPKGLRQLQVVTWNPGMTTTIQDDRFDGVVHSILSKSHTLSSFSLEPSDCPEPKPLQSPQLHRRGELRRSLYERPLATTVNVTNAQDSVYYPRDQIADTPGAKKVFQIARTLRLQDAKVHKSQSLVAMLSKWPFIGGFHGSQSNEAHPLSDLINQKISEHWGSFVKFCLEPDSNAQFNVLFRLCLLAFGEKQDMDMLQIFAALARLDKLKSLPHPSASSFTDFKENEAPTLDCLLSLAAAGYPKYQGKRRDRQWTPKEHRDKSEEDGRRLAGFLLQQWPCPTPTVQGFTPSIIDVDAAFDHILPEWQRLYSNKGLQEYLGKCQSALDDIRGPKEKPAPKPRPVRSTVFSWQRRTGVIPHLSKDLISKDSIAHLPMRLNDTRATERITESQKVVQDLRPASEIAELARLLESFTSSSNLLRKHYGEDLRQSLAAFESMKPPSSAENQMGMYDIESEIQATRRVLAVRLTEIDDMLSFCDTRAKWLKLGNMWPCTTRVTVLELLRTSSALKFGRNIRENILNFGREITELQQLLRLQDACQRGDQNREREERRNLGHQNWSPLDFPDWLLLEIDSDILIREEQVEVANAIIAPSSKSNTVLQMNMGKGKTSCIMPMAAAFLADGEQICRLIVPKALLTQTAQTLQSKLGGLVGRQVLHIPFARRSPTSMAKLEQFQRFHRQMLGSCGVMLSTPEHILSFKLSGPQRLRDAEFAEKKSAKKLQEARSMIEFQNWLTKMARDVLDESDFTLSVKTQLIYPSGSQEYLDGHPQRWQVTQTLLSMIEDHLPGLKRAFKRDLTVVSRGHGSFPAVHFLKSQAEDAVHRILIQDLSHGKASFVRFRESAPPEAVQEFRAVLSEELVDSVRIDSLMQHFADPVSARQNLYLIRGLIQNRILIMCLRRRWNVQYGLHPTREPIAVPFEAKGVPHDQAEFGHPDVAIVLTCLSFYYFGITLSQFRDALQRVLNSDDPSGEYERWTGGYQNLPVNLHHWNIINLDDTKQIWELWKHLQFNRSVLNHYMNSFVFPIHARQFTVKLQASGWDLPQFSPLKHKDAANLTTGFSGTNDNKLMLPLTIKQDDLPNLRYTSAEVLTYLLQPRSRHYVQAEDAVGAPLSEGGLLRALHRRKIRVLIDAGAYILDMDNEKLAEEWLAIDTEAKGAVYFKYDNRAWVKYRGSKKPDTPLLATPFADKLEECVVYLDEVHTRGTDMKFSPDARGALTLALGQTKDHTVQAAMRLRQLGTTQAVTFFAPPEVHRSIIDLRGKDEQAQINSADVVHWLMEQTCRANEQLQNLYFAQGSDFCHRSAAARDYERMLVDEYDRSAFLRIIEQPERQSLQEMYGRSATEKKAEVLAKAKQNNRLSSAKLQNFMNELMRQRRIGSDFNEAIPDDVLCEVEQEREVEHQVEEQRALQVQVPRRPLKFPGLHEHISFFVNTGTRNGLWSFMHAFELIATTSIGKETGVQVTVNGLFVSYEFNKSVQLGRMDHKDEFLRSVEWVLWSKVADTALIITPEEADLVIPMLRAQAEKQVYLVTYAAPVTKNMHDLGDLKYYTIPSLPRGYEFPSWVVLELGIFAGRLYMNYSQYTAISEMVHNFAKHPTEFLFKWLTLRRRGQDILHTPMGYLCQGRQLTEEHSFFQTNHLARSAPVHTTSSGDDTATGNGSDDSDTSDSDEDSFEEAAEDVVDDAMEGAADGSADDVHSLDDETYGSEP